MKQTIEVDLLWYMLDQNNSGGYYYKNKDVQPYVFIQAQSKEEATAKAERIVAQYSNYCPCCGERWSTDFYYDEGMDAPEIWGQSLDKKPKYSFHSNGVVLYHFNGKRTYAKVGLGEVPYSELEDD